MLRITVRWDRRSSQILDKSLERGNSPSSFSCRPQDRPSSFPFFSHSQELFDILEHERSGGNTVLWTNEDSCGSPYRKGPSGDGGRSRDSCPDAMQG